MQNMAKFVGLIITACITFLISLAETEIIDLSSSSTYQWEAALRNKSIEVKGTVPGSIYTDLEKAGGYLTNGPLLFRFNDIEYRWVSYQDWDYSLQFDVSSDVLSNRGIDLVFYGVDTVSDISLNGQLLGTTNNMFIRYRYDVKNILKERENSLMVRFTSPIKWSKDFYDQLEQDQGYAVPPECPEPVQYGECQVNHIRKMQIAFSWDWAPAFPTMGLWLPVKIEAYNTVTIRDWWAGTERDEQLQLWNLGIKMHCETLDTNILHRGVFTVSITDPETGRVIVSRLQSAAFVSDDNKEATFALDTIPILFSEVEQWMPNGWGNQKMYNIRLEFQEEGGSLGGYFMLEDRVAFRTIELVEEDMSVGRSYYFRINGEPVFIKGSNWIPSTVLPELETEDNIRKILTSVKKAHMNALRIWGGGMYEFNEFYRIADELGILIWHDMMFASAMYPATEDYLADVSVEIRQQVRRLSRHPSVLIWSGNNENEAALRQNRYDTDSKFEIYKEDYIKLYVDTIKNIIKEEDPSRPFAVSSPSNGKKCEEDGYISTDPETSEYGDVHYFYYLGDMWNWESYPKPRMATEYGFQALPSVHAWRTAADPIGTPGSTDWDFDGELLDKRQHHPNGNSELIFQVEKQLGKARSGTPEQRFLDMIYLTQMHQAEAIKIESEHYRRLQRLTFDGLGNCMGALYWQLQDIWQAPSWGSIELGGRWKPLHYFAVKFFAPLTFMLWVRDGVVSVFPSDFRNGTDMIPGVLQIQLHSWSQLSPIFTQRIPNVNGSITLEWQRPLDSWLLENGCTRQTCFLTVTYEGLQDGQWITPDGYLFLNNFNQVTNLAQADVKIVSVSQVYASEESQWSIDVTISTDKPAAFVWLDTNEDRPGRFSDNGFLMSTVTRTITFWSELTISAQELSNDLIIQHLAQIIR